MYNISMILEVFLNDIIQAILTSFSDGCNLAVLSNREKSFFMTPLQ